MIENTIFEEIKNSEEKLIFYKIEPKEGYILHVKELDEPVLDENGNETGEVKKGYTKAFTTVEASYDFEKNEREIYAVEV